MLCSLVAATINRSYVAGTLLTCHLGQRSDTLLPLDILAGNIDTRSQPAPPVSLGPWISRDAVGNNAQHNSAHDRHREGTATWQFAIYYDNGKHDTC